MFFKDHFSSQSRDYAKYRPTYPVELFRDLADISPSCNYALDVATGNGQAAAGLLKYFNVVIAFDASKNQIAHVNKGYQIKYMVAIAEQIPVRDSSIDLITCAQAVHWFNWELFNNETSRILNKEGIIAIWGYGLPQVNKTIDEIIWNYYSNIVGKFWAKERTYVENEYNQIPFPFKLLKSHDYLINLSWRFENLIGFLNSWSATRSYINTLQKNPIQEIKNELSNAWFSGDEIKNIIWPLFVKFGKLT